jgi:excisionase family DNA binding protein
MTQLLTVSEMQKILKISRSALYRLIAPDHSPRLPFVQVGGVRRFDPADVQAFLDSQKH